MYRISKDFSFSASHVLRGLPDGHPCGRLHGHNYTVRLVFEAPAIDAVGFVIDYRALGRFKDWLDETFDHKHINDVLLANPTAETLAEYLFGVVARLYPAAPLAEVAVSETPKTWAAYRPQ